jgi:hypothetical protein
MTDAGEGIPGGARRATAVVVRRALCLSAVVCRASIDGAAREPEAEALRDRVLEWVRDLGLWEETEQVERDVLIAPLGSLSSPVVSRLTWYVEGLGVLGWALHLMDFPLHDQKVDPFLVTDLFGLLDAGALALVNDAAMRSEADLQACRELMYAVHARLRGFLRNGSQCDFTRWVEPDWTARLGIDPATLFYRTDLSVDGSSIDSAPPIRVHECEWITAERHRAIIWLLGGSATYSGARADT